jgi:hypothetical protein
MVERQLYPYSSPTEDIMNLASTSSSTSTTTSLTNESDSTNLRRIRSSTTKSNYGDDEKQNILKVVDDELQPQQQQQKFHKNHSKSNEKSWRTLKSWDKMFVFKPLNVVFFGIVFSIILCLFTYISFFMVPLSKSQTTSPFLTSSIPIPKTIYSGMEPK